MFCRYDQTLRAVAFTVLEPRPAASLSAGAALTVGVCVYPPGGSLQAAARHQCSYLVQQHSAAFLEAGGDEGWLGGVRQAPAKLHRLQALNKLLAHRPWLITQQHIQVGGAHTGGRGHTQVGGVT